MKTTTNSTDAYLYAVREGERDYGDYLVREFAQKHLVALMTWWPDSQAGIVAERISTIDAQRVVVEGWRVGVDPHTGQEEQARQLGLTTVYYAKVEKLTVTPQEDLQGVVTLNEEELAVSYHPYTLTWYLTEMRQGHTVTLSEQERLPCYSS